MWRFIVVSQQLSGAAMIWWSAYIHRRHEVKCAVLVAVVVGRSGAQVRLESSGRTELEMKDE